jgi:hypothetical protein
VSAIGPDGYLARLQAVIDGLEQDVRQSDRALGERQSGRAQEARDGKLGPDWAGVQRRIDAGQTTLADVFTGSDDTPAARRLRELSQQNISRMAEEDPSAEVQLELAEAEVQWAALNREITPGDPA